eukprot:gb/GEZJ01003954.1/.p1 GENE.gb/GEZJ01003954.1/~~gb/GEZJ01003954.1/.p1  ORF type:complete len:134 (+),score=12.79 gb/GEZJ01003954.1/:380-781(+)
MPFARTIPVILFLTICVSQASSLTIICILSSISRLCFSEHGHGARCRPLWNLNGVAVLTVGGDVRGEMQASKLILLKEDTAYPSSCRIAGNLEQTDVPATGVTCELGIGRTPRDEEEGNFAAFSFGTPVFSQC